jgi:hypothetical protein
LVPVDISTMWASLSMTRKPAFEREREVQIRALDEKIASPTGAPSYPATFVPSPSLSLKAMPMFEGQTDKQFPTKAVRQATELGNVKMPFGCEKIVL